jgi:hypothetical protein
MTSIFFPPVPHKFAEHAAWALEHRGEGTKLDLATGRELADTDAIPVLENAVGVPRRGGREMRQGRRGAAR